MPVPEELTRNDQVNIFRYSADLQDACNTLRERLGGNGVPITTINTTRTPAEIGGDLSGGRVIAWLVGHGLANQDTIGTQINRSNALAITDIIEWLCSNGYTHVVDTCCEPDTRRQANMRGLIYYCARDGQNVTENQNHDTLHDWWDENGMHQI